MATSGDVYVQQAYDAIEAEREAAMAANGPFSSNHAALGVITEEYFELVGAIREKGPDALEHVMSEAIQLAAMSTQLVAQINWTLSEQAKEKAQGKKCLLCGGTGTVKGCAHSSAIEEECDKRNCKTCSVQCYLCNGTGILQHGTA